VSHGDAVNLLPGVVPEDYHCRCDYCQKAIGELRPADGTYYSRLERNAYYDKSERGPTGHVAKTPLHVARWAVQAYTAPGDWVLDPTIGAGTTAVEALTQGRNVMGMELQYAEVVKANVRRAYEIRTADQLMSKEPLPNVTALIRLGDARTVRDFLSEYGHRIRLVVNNPPYSGDEGNPGKTFKGTLKYQDGLPNLAFLKEGRAYWDALRTIYRSCADALVPGGRFVVGVKDMMRRREPFLLHHDLCDLLGAIPGLSFEGTAFLRHYPGTLHLNSYEKRYGRTPPLYQTISVFKKAETISVFKKAA
jgi:hypothetical protein